MKRFIHNNFLHAYAVAMYSASIIDTTRKKLINDTLIASLKSYNDASLNRHSLDCHCISLHTMMLISSVIFCESKL